MNIFSYDSKFSQLLIKISYGCWLNLLWMICSLPIVTIGASTTALYDVCLRIAEEREHNVTKQFFTAFKNNFKQSTRLWLILLAAGLVLGADGYIVHNLRSSSVGLPAVFWTLNLALLIAAAVVYTIVLLYIFPLIARFENNDKAMLKNAFLFGIRYLFNTILMFAIHFAMFFAIVSIFTPLILFGEGIVALICSNFLIYVFGTAAVEPSVQDESRGDS